MVSAIDKIGQIVLRRGRTRRGKKYVREGEEVIGEGHLRVDPEVVARIVVWDVAVQSLKRRPAITRTATGASFGNRSLPTSVRVVWASCLTRSSIATSPQQQSSGSVSAQVHVQLPLTSYFSIQSSMMSRSKKISIVKGASPPPPKTVTTPRKFVPGTRDSG